MSHKLLLADADGSTQSLLQEHLQVAGYRVYSVYCAGAAAAALQTPHPFGLILLDPACGTDRCSAVIRNVRAAACHAPLIVISDQAREMDVVGALRSGADDFVAKPVPVFELLERIRLRLRSAAADKPAELVACNLVINPAQRRVRVAGEEVSLRPKEFDLLTALIEAGGDVLSRELLLRDVWGHPAKLNTRTVEQHILTLRRKLRVYGYDTCIRTVARHGFAFTVPPDLQ